MAKPKNINTREGLRRRSLSDPLSAALLPPPNETLEQKEERLRVEVEAKRVSDGIDEMIKQDKAELKKTKADVSVLLLGQSESGKSTTLKREFIDYTLHCSFSTLALSNWASGRAMCSLQRSITGLLDSCGGTHCCDSTRLPRHKAV